ncbi:hypothetical protein Ahia01_001088700 [Argonauta hians]
MAKSPLQNVPSTPLLTNPQINSPIAVVPCNRTPRVNTPGKFDIGTPVVTPKLQENGEENGEEPSPNVFRKKSHPMLESFPLNTSDQQVPGTPNPSLKNSTPIVSSNRQKVHERRCMSVKNQEINGSTNNLEDSDEVLPEQVPDIPHLNLFCGDEIFI